MKRRFVNLRVPAARSRPGEPDTVPRDILVIDGRIADVTAPTERPVESDEDRIDLENALVLPGAIDGHVHFNDPGFPHRENFERGTRAAAAGGVTCVVDMPCTSLPPVTSRQSLQRKLTVIEANARVDFMLWGGVSSNAMGEGDWVAHLEELDLELTQSSPFAHHDREVHWGHMLV